MSTSSSVANTNGIHDVGSVTGLGTKGHANFLFALTNVNWLSFSCLPCSHTEQLPGCFDIGAKEQKSGVSKLRRHFIICVPLSAASTVLRPLLSEAKTALFIKSIGKAGWIDQLWFSRFFWCAAEFWLWFGQILFQ